MVYTRTCGSTVTTSDWANFTPAYLADVDALLSEATIPPADPSNAVTGTYGFSVPGAATVTQLAGIWYGTASTTGTIEFELTYDGTTVVESSFGPVTSGVPYVFTAIPTPAQANALTFGLKLIIGGSSGDLFVNQVAIIITDDQIAPDGVNPLQGTNLANGSIFQGRAL